MDNWLFIFILVIILLVVGLCIDHERLKEDLKKEEELLNTDEVTRNSKLEVKEKRNKLKQYTRKTLLCIIACSPYISLPVIQNTWEFIQKLLFSLAVLFFNSSSYLQTFINHIDAILSWLFFRRLERQISALDLTIETRKKKIQKIKAELNAWC